MKQKLKVYYDHLEWSGTIYNDQLDGCSVATYKDIIQHIVDNRTYEYFDDLKEEVRDSYSWIYYPSEFGSWDKKLQRMTVDEFNKLLINSIDTITLDEIKAIGFDLIYLLYNY